MESELKASSSTGREPEEYYVTLPGAVPLRDMQICNEGEPPSATLEMLDEDSGSDAVSDLLSVSESGEECVSWSESDVEPMEVDNMQFYSMDVMGAIHPLSLPGTQNEAKVRGEEDAKEEGDRSTLRSPFVNEDRSRMMDVTREEDGESFRARSPLRSPARTITPPAYSPVGSPMRTCSQGSPSERAYGEYWVPAVSPSRLLSRADSHSSIVQDQAGQAAGRARGRAGPRGRVGVRGRESVGVRGCRPARGGGAAPRVTYRGRGRCAAMRAVEGEREWQLGEPIKEVCVNDEDIPPCLRGIMNVLERDRRARNEREESRERRRHVSVHGDESDEDEFYDAQGSLAHDLFRGDREALQFHWSPMATFSGNAEEFLVQNPGPTENVSSAYGAFRKFWDDDILDHIVRETNRYASVLKSSSQRFARDWYDTNVHEILILFAFWMMLGVIRMPSIQSCFSTRPSLHTGIFRSLITLSRYWILNRALHFVDNSTRTPDSPKLFCLGPLVKHLNRKFQAAYILGQNIAIDESLTLWKGNLSFRQYIRTKAARFGIKTFELCESATGYMWSFSIYTGKEKDSQAQMLKSTEIVIRLMRPLLNNGHRLYLDNWFNSPLLARYLKNNKTDCIGTLRKCRKNVPALIQLVSLTPGTCVARHSGDVVVMAYQDKMPVYTISTCHGTESVLSAAKPGRVAQYKPAVIADYNKSMGGVDKKDQMLQPFLLERKKNRKWYKKMFKRLLNVSINNSRILLDKSTQDVVGQQVFRLELVEAIISEHLPHVPQKRRISPTSTDLPVTRFSEGHYIMRATVDHGSRTDDSGNSLGRGSCRWCLARNHRRCKTVYKCKKCQVYLCLEPCFEKFHTLP